VTSGSSLAALLRRIDKVDEELAVPIEHLMVCMQATYEAAGFNTSTHYSVVLDQIRKWRRDEELRRQMTD
tara:strand:+ start:135 stop:344 length:210 start_codon:yes stop_codon:yes gene_type:complete